MKLPEVDHVPARTVRFWALFDSGVLALALPVTARPFLDLLYRLNGWLFGGTAIAPALDPLAMFFVNLSGVMVLVWVAARLIRPHGALALVDVIGRCLVSLLIAWAILATGVIPILWLFVVTEMLGAVMQGLALRRCETVR